MMRNGEEFGLPDDHEWGSSAFGHEHKPAPQTKPSPRKSSNGYFSKKPAAPEKPADPYGMAFGDAEKQKKKPAKTGFFARKSSKTAVRGGAPKASHSSVAFGDSSSYGSGSSDFGLDSSTYGLGTDSSSYGLGGDSSTYGYGGSGGGGGGGGGGSGGGDDDGFGAYDGDYMAYGGGGGGNQARGRSNSSLTSSPYKQTKSEVKGEKYQCTWQEDGKADGCNICGVTFGALKRKHHCRKW
jgi:hypothetical protein